MMYLQPSLGITAHRTILFNTLTKCAFVATKTTERNQCEGENRNHIKAIGDLHVAADDAAQLIRELYKEVAHGDLEHREWLHNSFENFISRKCLDEPKRYSL